jgi:hypothetical protein
VYVRVKRNLINIRMKTYAFFFTRNWKVIVVLGSLAMMFTN